VAASNPWLILPFVLLLGVMALAPVAVPRWWRRFYAPVALGLGAVTAGIYLFGLHDPVSLGGAVREYFSFIALIGSLYVVSGGIHIAVKGGATPGANVIFLLIGAGAANFLGTTGAAMLLIRPWIRMNQPRIAAHHIVFFIFLVANVGGGLTPIGDPPLFLGFLQGVPFGWIVKQGGLVWLTATGLLLGIFYVVDKIHFQRAPQAVRDKEAAPESWKFEGLGNLFFLGVILGAVFVEHPPFLREGLMLAAAAGSYFTTRKTVHAANGFDFHPVVEVAVLFAGIFATMIPALAWLEHGGQTLLGGCPSPGVFFWSTGALSSVLDNAPTYLGFFHALQGVAGTTATGSLLASHASHLLAISFGAVFFGAATYIGNGPNFMVKAVAEQHGVRMPSFGAFILRFTLPFLLPVLIMVWLLFFQG
jgi:Na+/H+ antiporter NhaD/arsenite permease-like protein